MTEVLSSRKLREVPAFKGKDVTRPQLTSAAQSCPALRGQNSPRETFSPQDGCDLSALGAVNPKHPTAHRPDPGCDTDGKFLSKAPVTPSRTLCTVPGGHRGGFPILPIKGEPSPSSELYDQEPNSIQSGSLFEG